MAKKETMDIDAVRQLAMAFDDVNESKGRGVSSFRARGKLMICPAMNKSAEPDSLVAQSVWGNVTSSLPKTRASTT
jgi:hypothetical protein